MRLSAFALIAVVAFPVLSAMPAHAAPPNKVLDRVVAAVKGRPILFSEVRRRAVPLFLQARTAALAADKRPAAETEIVKRLVERMIEDRLIYIDTAERGQMSVAAEEIDQRIAASARQSGLTPADVLREAKNQGMDVQDYRDEIERQLYDGKWLELRIRPKVTASTTLDAERKKRLDELRREIEIEVLP